MQDTKLKTYKVFIGTDYINGDGKLVFAHNLQESKKIFYNYIRNGVDENANWLEVKSKLIKGKNFLYLSTYEKYLKDNIPHLVAYPSNCSVCGNWECDGRKHEDEDYFVTEGMDNNE